MTLAALEAPKARIGSLVTSPFMRHSLVAANAFATTDELTGWRAITGLTTGGSTALAIGRAPATQKQVRAELVALRQLFAGKEIAREGRFVKSLRFARQVPIYYSAFGPKALSLAGKLADGAMLFAGDQSLDALDQRLATLRDADALDIWVTRYISVRKQQQQAIAGPEDYMAGVMGRMEAMGVSTLVAAHHGHADRQTTIRGFAAARKRM